MKKNITKNFSKITFIAALLSVSGNVLAQQKIILDYGSKKTYAINSAIAMLTPNAGTAVSAPNKYGTLNLVAGNGSQSTVDNSNPLLATFNNPLDLAIDKNGNIFVSDNGSKKLRVIHSGGVSTVKKSDGTDLEITSINGLDIYDNKLFISSEADKIIRFATIPAVVTENYTFTNITVPSSSNLGDIAIDSAAMETDPTKITFFVNDASKTTIKKFSYDMASETTSQLVIPTLPTDLSGVNQLKVMHNGDIYFANRNTDQIFKYTYNSASNTYTKSILAGNGTERPVTENTVYNSLILKDPLDVWVDKNTGKVYFTEYTGTRIRVYDPTSPDKVLTLIGQDTGAPSVDNTAGYDARGAGHFGLKMFNKSLYFAQRDGRRITKVDISSGKFPYTISPSLPTGLVFNNYTAEITGTPKELSSLTTYIVATNDNNGNIVGTANLQLEVLAITPVTLKSFDTKKQTNGNVSLSWVTVAEENNNRFVLSKSTDGANFKTLVEKPTLGNQGGNYSYNDASVADGANYYKLQQIDNDGTTKDLGIKVVQGGLTTASWSVYPNPSKGEHISIRYIGKNITKRVKLFNLAGQLLTSKNINLNGDTLFKLDNKLAAGLYTLQIDGLGIQKIIVQ